ncbi:MAG: TolC family protein [Armatimonadota bacterium]|nr:TolC family protein [bacterium]
MSELISRIIPRGKLTAVLSITWIYVFFTSVCIASTELPIKLSMRNAVSAALNTNANLKQAESKQISSISKLRIASLSTSFDAGSRAVVERTSNDRTRSSNLFGGFDFQGLSGTEMSLDVSPYGFGQNRGEVTLQFRRPLTRGKGLLSTKSDKVLGARSDATVQEKQYYLTTQATVLGVVEAYYAAVLASEQVKVQESALAITQEAADGARKRADAGLVAEIEVSRAEIRVAQTKNELNRQKQNARGALDRLMVAIGTGVGQTPELTDGVPEPIADQPSLADAVKTALKNRSELTISEENLTELSRKVMMANDSMRSGLDFVAGFDSSNSDTGILSRTILDQGDFTAGFEYKLPLDKRALVEERRIAERDLDTSRKLRMFQMEQIAQQVRNAYRGVDTARTSLDIFGQNLAVAEDNLRLAQRMVDEGLRDNREVLDAQESLTLVRNQLLSAKVDLYLAGVNLKYAMGENLAHVIGN